MGISPRQTLIALFSPARCRELSPEHEATLGIQEGRAGAEGVPVVSGIQLLSQEMDFLEPGEALGAGPVEHQHHILEQLSTGRRKDFCRETQRQLINSGGHCYYFLSYRVRPAYESQAGAEC